MKISDLKSLWVKNSVARALQLWVSGAHYNSLSISARRKGSPVASYSQLISSYPFAVLRSWIRCQYCYGMQSSLWGIHDPRAPVPLFEGSRIRSRESAGSKQWIHNIWLDKMCFISSMLFYKTPTWPQKGYIGSRCPVGVCVIISGCLTSTPLHASPLTTRARRTRVWSLSVGKVQMIALTS